MPDSTVVLAVRHTDVHNPENVFYGRLPRFHLSSLGEAQAERTASYLATLPLAGIYVSPQLRARQTARAIASQHQEVPVIVTWLLSEVFTSWQGTPFSVLGANVNIYEPPKLPTDESIAMIFNRMNRALQRAAAEHPGQTTVLVSHADPIMVLRVGLQGQPLNFASIRAANYPEKGSVTQFEIVPGEALPRVSYYDVQRQALLATV